ncbi:MAG: hypothetical protein JWP66_336 [Naasia sp.]|nr:hypothetical protein [Naasia sp.]
MEAWFACPKCGRDLEEQGTGFACPSGHRFEPARRGYVALVGGRSTLVRGVPAAELDAVDALYASGGMDAVAHAVVAMLPAGVELRVLDAGTDLGHLLAAARAPRAGLRAVAVSSSPSSLARGVTRSGADGLLADPVRPWPLRDSAVDVALLAFADLRPAELHRVLAPGGVLLAATPEEEGLAVMNDVYPWFEHDQTRVVDGAGRPTAVLRFRRRRRVLVW